jgi:glycosyltransferase involved in cell wall biosynthesis
MVRTIRNSKPLISLVIPMYNEEETIPTLFSTLKEVLAEKFFDYEIVCVNDGSTDNTLQLLKKESGKNDSIKIISFSRNFGKEPAMTAALDFAQGDAVIPIDADLQDPPEFINEMVRLWFEEGFEVVNARRASRSSDGLLKRMTAGWFYKVFNAISEFPIPENVGDYRLMDRRVIDIIKQLPEKDRFMKGIYAWVGFNSTSIDFVRPERFQGETSFNYWKLWNFALTGITSFTTIPIRLGTYFGLLVSLFSFIYGSVIVCKTVLFGIDVPGYASTLISVLFLGGVQMIFLGMLGEYIGRIYKEVKNRPIYIVDEEIGFDENK